MSKHTGPRPAAATPSRPTTETGIPHNQLIIRLELATFAYLGLPVALWLACWLQPWIGLPLIAALGFAIWSAWPGTVHRFSFPQTLQHPARFLPLWPFVGAMILAGLWGFFSGAGGIAFCTEDWEKHFAILKDLTLAPWPVVYDLGGQDTPLVYYFGYYLPAAAVAKLLGWSAGCIAHLIWTCLGTMLAAAWFTLLAGRRPFLAVLFFIFANGLDFIGERLLSGAPFKSGIEHLDWWSGWLFLNFPGHYSQLTWAPQHSIAAWSVTAMLAVQLPLRRGLGHAGLLAGLAFFWSPFTLVGLAPFALVAIFRERARGLLSPANLIAAALVAVNALYLASRSGELPHAFFWQVHNLRVDWPRLLLFHLFEWGLFFLFARELRRSDDPWLRSLFWTAAAVLVVYPLYSLGLFNDWCMRATIPALLLLWAGVARSLLLPPFNSESRLLLVLVIFGSFGALAECSRSWVPLAPSPSPITSREHVTALHPDVVKQYLGSMDTFFWRHLAQPASSFSPTPPPPLSR